MPLSKKDIVSHLQKDILLLQGIKLPQLGGAGIMGLGSVETAFPNGVFPAGAIHEFLNPQPEHTAATTGFIGGLLKALMQNGGACLWIGIASTVFPPGLKFFGIEPERVIFVNVKTERDILWATEEALKCEGLAAVVAEMKEISFMQSRRLQLAIEQSRVTGFILRSDAGKLSATACAARWKITSLPSEPEQDMPGIGFPRWHVELLKVRNGNPGSWKIEWSDRGFTDVYDTVLPEQTRKAG